jgi:hypothetical protein
MESYGRMLQLKNLIQQGQMGNVQLQTAQLQQQQMQQEQQEQKIIQEAYGAVGGDLDKLHEAVAGKVSPKTSMAIKTASLADKERRAKQTKEEREAEKAIYEQTGNIVNGLLRADDKTMAATWPAARAQAIQFGVSPQILPEQFPGRQTIQMFANMIDGGKASMARDEEARKAAGEARTATEAAAKLPGIQADTAAKVADQQAREQWLARPENAGKTAADYEIYKKGEETKAGHIPTPGTDVPYSPEVEKQKVKIAGARATQNAAGVVPEETIIDSDSQSILSQTGLSMPAFLALTGQASSLPRDKVSRSRAFSEAQKWANKKGVDISTMSAQYKTYNEVLSKNISRMNNTKIMESELQGTIENLQGVVKAQDLDKLRFSNVIKIWAGQEVNDDLAQQYAMHLYQLRNELAAYGAATQGRSGNEITLQDQREAETTIRNGIAGKSLEGLATAIENSTSKMGAVMQKSVDSARKSVWGLFGVGGNYKSKSTQETGKTIKMKTPDGQTWDVPADKVEAAKQRGAVEAK